MSQTTSIAFISNEQTIFSAENFHFYAIRKSNPENAVSDEGFDGYIGLFPHVKHDTGEWDTERPSLVTELFIQNKIPAPIVTIDICKDNYPVKS